MDEKVRYLPVMIARFRCGRVTYTIDPPMMLTPVRDLVDDGIAWRIDATDSHLTTYDDDDPPHDARAAGLDFLRGQVLHNDPQWRPTPLAYDLMGRMTPRPARMDWRPMQPPEWVWGMHRFSAYRDAASNPERR